MTHQKNQRGSERQPLPRERLRLAKEIRSIQHRAAEHDGRIVSIGPLVLFSTKTGDAWILDPADQLAARLAYNGDPFRSTSRKPTPIMPSAGKDATASTATPSSMKTTNRGASLQSEAIRYTYSFA